MRNNIWRYRTQLRLLGIILIQIPFLLFKLLGPSLGVAQALTETSQLLATSGLAVYLFTRQFESWLEEQVYGGVRRSWQEVRVYYSRSPTLLGMGSYYPREPTILISPAGLGSKSGPHMSQPVIARTQSGGLEGIAAPLLHGPVIVHFNSSFSGEPSEPGAAFENGKWSQMRLMRDGASPPQDGFVVVGFPDTLYDAVELPPGASTSGFSHGNR